MSKEEKQHLPGFYKALLDNTRDGILILDPEMRIIQYNEHADRGMFFFYGKPIVLNTSLWDYLPKESNQPFIKNFNRAIKGKKVSAERRLTSPNGRDMWLETTFTPILNDLGKVTHVLYSYFNISDQKNKEEKIQSNQTILKSIYNSNIHKLVIVNKQGKVVYFNKSTREYVKDTYDANLQVGDSFLKYVPKRASSRFKNSFDIAVSGGVVSMEYEDECDGEEMFFEAHFDPIKSDEGKIELITLWVRDITDHKYAEQALKESEADLRDIFDNSAQTFYLIDKDYKVLAFNKAAEDMIWIQYRKKIKIGDHIEQYTLPENQQSEFQEIKKAFEGKPMVIEKQVKGKDYEYWFERHYNHLKNGEGEIDRVTIWSIDITERKKAEEALKNNERKFRALTSLSPAGIYQQDRNSHPIYVNERLAEIYGVNMVEALTSQWVKKIHPDDIDAYRALRRKALAYQEPFFHEYRILNGEQATHVIEHAVPLKNNLDEFIGYLGTLLDISEHKKSEQILAEKRHIERSLKFKSEFLASMSHEIRTPLNGILTMTELLLQAGLNDEQEEYANNIFSSSKTLRSIVNDILDLSKLEAGKVTINDSDFNFKYFMKEIESVYKRMAEEKRLTFKVSYDNAVPELMSTDRRRLMQVLTNLLRNALKFTDKGGININVNYSGDNDSGSLKFEIIDTGIGIDKNDIEELFQDYSQVSHSLKQELEGTGLGLSISKRLVELLGGKIGVKSEKGKGSTFWFNIPVRNLGQAKVEHEAPPKHTKDKVIAEQPAFSCRVLLVEDNLINQKAFSVMLKKMGCSVEMASTGVEAIEKYKDGLYDIIFMDIQMPDMNGLEATKQIKSSKKAPPVIGLSGNIFHGDNSKPEDNMMDDFILKPIVSQDLQATLTKWAALGSAKA